MPCLSKKQSKTSLGCTARGLTLSYTLHSCLVSCTGGFVVDDDGLGYDDAGEEDDYFNRDGGRDDDDEAGEGGKGGGGEGNKRKGAAGAAVGKKRKSDGAGEGNWSFSK